MISFSNWLNEEKDMDPKEFTSYLTKLGHKVKGVSGNTITILVSGSRIDKMLELAATLKKMGATIDKNMKGSSIGGIQVGKIRIMIKADGKTGGLDVELNAINDLSNAIAIAVISNGGPITVKLKNKTVKGVVDVVKTSGTPKSDFHLADINGKPLVHISHKKGSTPKDFQQWGGVTEKRISEHKEVLAFAEKCRGLYGDQIPNGESVMIKIKDKNLKMMSVFGVNFDSAGLNENKVDVLLQGDPGLKQLSNGAFELTATGHVHYHGDVPDGGFEPVLAMIYKGDRDQFGIKGARASIYPMNGRNFKTKL